MIYERMKARRSVRRFKPDPVARPLVERLLEAAVTAPSASNKQPWRFFVVERREVIADMAAAVREAVARVEAHLPDESRAAFRAYGDYFTRFEGAPVVIAPIFRGATVLSNLVDAELHEDDRRAIAAMERDSGLIGTSIAIGNLLLMAGELGLGASVMTGPLVGGRALRAILGVPDAWGLACLVAVGHPDEAPEPTERKAVAKVTRWI